MGRKAGWDVSIWHAVRSVARRKRREVRQRQAAAREAARLARHARRFSADALRARALGKAERELIRNTVRHYALRGMRITVDGYATLKAKARAEVAAGSFPPVI